MKWFYTIDLHTLKGLIELRIYWGWFKDLFTFKRRTYDGKLFAIRRLWYFDSSNKKEIYKSLAIWFLEITYIKEKPNVVKEKQCHKS